MLQAVEFPEEARPPLAEVGFFHAWPPLSDQPAQTTIRKLDRAQPEVVTVQAMPAPDSPRLDAQQLGQLFRRERLALVIRGNLAQVFQGLAAESGEIFGGAGLGGREGIFLIRHDLPLGCLPVERNRKFLTVNVDSC